MHSLKLAIEYEKIWEIVERNFYIKLFIVRDDTLQADCLLDSHET